MSKLTVIEFITLDGVMQAPGSPDEDTSGNFSHGGWTVPYFDEFLGEIMSQQMSLDNASLLLGRKTYQIFASYWPDHSNDWPGINEVDKYVVSGNGSFDPTWKNSNLITGHIVKKIEALKNKKGPNLQVWGSSTLVQSLLQHDLVDELWLKIFPITLGTGKRLFADGTIPAAFKLSDNKISPKGVIIANYSRAGDVKTGSFV